MTENLFRDNVLVALQGESALEFIEEKVNHIVYRIIGFDDNEVILRDFREETFLGLQHFFETGDPRPFQEQFNSSASARIWLTPENQMIIELYSCDKTDPEFTLWISIGIGRIVPTFDYLIFESHPLKNGRFALLSLYQNPPQDCLEVDCLALNNHEHIPVE